MNPEVNELRFACIIIAFSELTHFLFLEPHGALEAPYPVYKTGASPSMLMRLLFLKIANYSKKKKRLGTF